MLRGIIAKVDNMQEQVDNKSKQMETLKKNQKKKRSVNKSTTL